MLLLNVYLYCIRVAESQPHEELFILNFTDSLLLKWFVILYIKSFLFFIIQFDNLQLVVKYYFKKKIKIIGQTNTEITNYNLTRKRITSMMYLSEYVYLHDNACNCSFLEFY